MNMLPRGYRLHLRFQSTGMESPTGLHTPYAPRYLTITPLSFNLVGPSLHKIPVYLNKTGYRNPHSSNGPFQYAHNTKLSFWAWMNEHPDMAQRFNNYMSGYRQGKASWMDPDFYPVVEKLGRDLKDEKDAALLVDVGGSLGHDLEEFKAKHPRMPGRLVLQDRPEVIRQIKKLSPGIEASAHDFFTPQPIQGIDDIISGLFQSSLTIYRSESVLPALCAP